MSFDSTNLEKELEDISDALLNVGKNLHNIDESIRHQIRRSDENTKKIVEAIDRLTKATKNTRSSK